MASDVFSMQGEAQPLVESTQLGLEQGPVRKTPPLLIETTQISLSAPHSLFLFQDQRREIPANDYFFPKEMVSF